jgi:hypothetical protein
LLATGLLAVSVQPSPAMANGTTATEAGISQRRVTPDAATNRAYEIQLRNDDIQNPFKATATGRAFC